jgi:hypothetical protein
MAPSLMAILGFGINTMYGTRLTIRVELKFGLLATYVYGILECIL